MWLFFCFENGWRHDFTKMSNFNRESDFDGDSDFVRANDFDKDGDFTYYAILLGLVVLMK